MRSHFSSEISVKSQTYKVRSQFSSEISLRSHQKVRSQSIFSGEIVKLGGGGGILVPKSCKVGKNPSPNSVRVWSNIPVST